MLSQGTVAGSPGFQMHRIRLKTLCRLVQQGEQKRTNITFQCMVAFCNALATATARRSTLSELGRQGSEVLPLQPVSARRASTSYTRMGATSMIFATRFMAASDSHPPFCMLRQVQQRDAGSLLVVAGETAQDLRHLVRNAHSLG